MKLHDVFVCFTYIAVAFLFFLSLQNVKNIYVVSLLVKKCPDAFHPDILV